MGVVLLAVSALGYLLALKIGGKGILTPAQHGSRGAAAHEPLRFTPPCSSAGRRWRWCW
jgi:putative spermidine/putrescine transport system permease protein